MRAKYTFACVHSTTAFSSSYMKDITHWNQASRKANYW